MKKIITLLIITLLLVSGCAVNKPEDKKLKIYTSFDLIKDFTSKIVKDKAEVIPLVESGEEVHDYEITTKQLTDIAKADVVIYNGLGMETWIDKLKENVKNISYIDTSVGIKVLVGGHEHEHDEKEHDHHHEVNPHVWTSIGNAKIQVKNIAEQLMKIDAKNKDFYQKNLEETLAKFTELEKEYQEKLSNTKRKVIVVSHAAYSYLADDYGLEEHAISGVSPQLEPSLAKLKELVELVKEEDVTTIFFDENVSDAVTSVLAKEANVKTNVLYTLEKYPPNEDYISLMRKNLNHLVKALNE